MAAVKRIPHRLTGKWAVVSSQKPGEKQQAGEILDEWIISSDSLRSDAGLLKVQKVEVKNEPHQEMVLVSFANNSLQYAFMNSEKQPDVVLVVMYLDSVEQMRCLITQAVYRD